MLESLQITNFIIAIATGAFALLITLSKPFRQWLLNVKNEKKDDEAKDEISRETDMCLLRDRITSVYFKHYRDCEIKEYEYLNVQHLYQQYKKIGGNTYVDKIWAEMQEWQIIP